MDYKIKDLCSKIGFGISKFYRLKNILDSSVPEQNISEYYYNVGNKFFITEKGFEWFKNNSINTKIDNNRHSSTSNNIIVYQNQIIDIYKQRIEYLENENKRLLDIISFKEQKEIAKDIKKIECNNNTSFWDRFINKIKK